MKSDDYFYSNPADRRHTQTHKQDQKQSPRFVRGGNNDCCGDLRQNVISTEYKIGFSYHKSFMSFSTAECNVFFYSQRRILLFNPLRKELHHLERTETKKSCSARHNKHTRPRTIVVCTWSQSDHMRRSYGRKTIAAFRDYDLDFDRNLTGR